MWEPRRLTILWASTACYSDSFIFFYPCFEKCKQAYAISILIVCLYACVSVDPPLLTFESVKQYL
jgi:hypothetical protein